MNTVKRQCLAFAMLFMSGVTNPVFASASSSPSHLEGQDETNAVITPRQAVHHLTIAVLMLDDCGDLTEKAKVDAPSLTAINLPLALKVMAVTGQCDKGRFKNALEDLAEYIETSFPVRDGENQNLEWVSLVKKIDSHDLRMLLGVEPLGTNDVLKLFWRHNAGQSQVILNDIEINKAEKESLPDDSDLKLTKDFLSLVLGRKLFAANNPDRDPLKGVGSDFLLLAPSTTQDLIFERAFVDKALSITKAQIKDSAKLPRFVVDSLNLLCSYYTLGIKLIDQMMVDGIEEKIALKTGGQEKVNTQAYLDYLRASCDYHTFAAKFTKGKLSPDDVVNAYLKANVNLAVFHNHFPNVDAPEWFDFNTDLAKFGGLATIKKQVAIMAELVDVEAEQTELMTFFGEIAI